MPRPCSNGGAAMATAPFSIWRSSLRLRSGVRRSKQPTGLFRLVKASRASPTHPVGELVDGFPRRVVDLRVADAEPRVGSAALGGFLPGNAVERRVAEVGYVPDVDEQGARG